MICNPRLVATGHNWLQLVATSPVAVLPFWADKKYQSSPVAFQKRQKNQTGLDFKTLARDGQVVRILGAWIGNSIDELAVWSPIIEKIDVRLKRWDLKKPSIEGQKIIAQWTIGAMTQYLTCAQGMPTYIEKTLTKCLTKFA